MEEDWAVLAERARAGDVAAFEKLVERFQRSICAAIHPVLRNWQLTEDVAQLAFVAAWRGLPKLREARSFRAWLFRIAHNLAVSRVRVLAARPAWTLSGVEEERVRCRPMDLRCGTTGAPPPAEILALVRREILALPNGYGTALVMRHVEGMSIDEMAVALRRRPQGVKSALHRARCLARKVLRQAGIDPLRGLDSKGTDEV